MNTRFPLRAGLASFALALAVFLGAATSAHAAEHDHAEHAAVDSPAAVAAYPLKTCVVSGDNLEGGDMGGPVNYVYKEAGKPDRLVRLCCKSCIKKFNKEPAKYLKMVDDATAGKGAGEAKAEDKGTK